MSDELEEMQAACEALCKHIATMNPTALSLMTRLLCGSLGPTWPEHKVAGELILKLYRAANADNEEP